MIMEGVNNHPATRVPLIIGFLIPFFSPTIVMQEQVTGDTTGFTDRRNHLNIPQKEIP